MITKSVVKDIQSLAGKKYRDQAGLFLAEGPKLVEELLRDCSHSIKAIYALESWIQQNRIVNSSIQVTLVTPAELERLSQLTTSHEVLAVVSKFPISPLQIGKGLPWFAVAFRIQEILVPSYAPQIGLVFAN